VATVRLSGESLCKGCLGDGLILALQKKRGSPLSRAPLHQHRRDEGQGGEQDPEDEERHHPLGPLLPAQSGQAEDAHRDAGGRQDGIDVFGQLKGEDGRLPGDAALAGV